MTFVDITTVEYISLQGTSYNRTLEIMTQSIGNTGDWRLTHISKNIREIFTVFGLEQMESGQIILG